MASERPAQLPQVAHCPPQQKQIPGRSPPYRGQLNHRMIVGNLERCCNSECEQEFRKAVASRLMPIHGILRNLSFCSRFQGDASDGRSSVSHQWLPSSSLQNAKWLDKHTIGSVQRFPNPLRHHHIHMRSLSSLSESRLRTAPEIT